MAVHRYFDHMSPDGKRVSQRVAAQGCNWRMVGVACVRQPGSQWGNYWTMVLATRR